MNLLAMTTASADPLAQLRDIHLPPPVSLWPPAPGWWLLAALLLIVAIGLPLWLWLRHRRRHWRWAKAELATIEKTLAAGADVRPLLLALASLLRRRALAIEPASAVAVLQGEAWQGYLCAGRRGLTAEQAGWLATALYLPPAALNQLAIDRPALLKAVRRWLKENGR